MTKLFIFSLRKVLLPNANKILNFSESSTTENNVCQEIVQHWPVRSRKKPEIYTPSVILDMPDLDTNICNNFIDWGSKGHLASIYQGNVHVWHQNVSGPYVSNTFGAVHHCVRWNREGTEFAAAFSVSQFAVIDVTQNKVVYIQKCCKKQICYISSLEWYKNDVVLSGCSEGKLTIWSSKQGLTKSIYSAHTSVIIAIKFSCADKYLATSCIQGIIRIWEWPNMEGIFEISLIAPTKSFSWHPWREPLLAVAGGTDNAFLSIWNVCRKKEAYSLPKQNMCIDAITFSNKTGELVVSSWYQKESRSKNVIEVLSNLSKVTDAVEWHTGRVSYLLWGNDGYKLATAGADESLCIWNFLGNSAEKTKSKLKPKKAYTINPMKNLNSFGCTIR